MKTPTLEEVKEYFKNAKEVKCLANDKIRKINDVVENLNESTEWNYGNYWLGNKKYNVLVYSDGKYAEIISYKQEIKIPNYIPFKEGKEIESEKQEGLRYNENKERWSLVDFEALKPMVKVLEFGAKKYDDHNWKKGLKTTEVAESLLRHLTAYLNGEDNDRETNLPHTGHILCNAMFLSHMHEFKKEFDTRYKKPCCGNWDELGNCKCKNNG